MGRRVRPSGGRSNKRSSRKSGPSRLAPLNQSVSVLELSQLSRTRTRPPLRSQSASPPMHPCNIQKSACDAVESSELHQFYVCLSAVGDTYQLRRRNLRIATESSPKRGLFAIARVRAKVSQNISVGPIGKATSYIGKLLACLGIEPSILPTLPQRLSIQDLRLSILALILEYSG
jgi:hypothetical protein